MDIEERISRRKRRDGEQVLARDYEPLSPVAHVDEPTDRDRLLERLLDHVEPIFEGGLPPNGYVYGPKGTGKSAVVTALFTRLGQLMPDPQSVIFTSTRVRPGRRLQFVYMDTRTTTSEFEFYHALVDALADEAVPERGIGTDTLRMRLDRQLAGTNIGLTLAVDHVGEPGSVAPASLVERFAGLPSNVSWLAIGRTRPTGTVLTNYTAESIRVDPYRTHVLVDVLMSRAGGGHSQLAIDHETAGQVADWADGDAHDAMAALLLAVDHADGDDRTAVTDADVTAATGAFPDRCVSLGRVLALPANKQSVLRALVALPPDRRETVIAATEAVSAAVDIQPSTIQRYIYELAEDGIVERVRSVTDRSQGRPPSRLEPRFPPAVFRRLYDIGE